VLVVALFSELPTSPILDRGPSYIIKKRKKGKVHGLTVLSIVIVRGEMPSLELTPVEALLPTWTKIEIYISVYRNPYSFIIRRT